MQCEDKVFVYKINVNDAEMCYPISCLYISLIILNICYMIKIKI